MPDKKSDKKVLELTVRRKGLFILRDSVRKFIQSYDEERDACQIPVRIESLDSVYKEFMEVQTELERLDDYENLEFNLIERADFETRYCEAKGFLLAKRIDPNQTILNASINANHQPSASTFHLRLPKIDLPKFDGNFTRWLSFKDTFFSMVHSNADIPTVAKLQYLLQSLEADARKPFESVDIEADNYTIVVDVLLKRYDNRKFLKRQLFRTIHELAPIKRESAHELHELVDEFQRHVKALGKLNEPIEQWNTPLVYMLTNKLDPVTLRAWEEKTSEDDDVKYDELIEFLYRRARIIKSVATDIQQRSPIGQSRVPCTSSSNKRNLPSKLVVNAATSEATHNMPSCFSCTERHFLFQCPVFAKMSIQQRRELVSQRKLCWNCFRSNHQARNCSSKYSCRTCRERHHTLLHVSSSTQKSSSSPVVIAPTQEPPPLATSPITQPGSIRAEVSVPALSHSATVLLETVVVNVVDNQGKEFQARGLLDSASMSNFMSKEFARLLSNPQETTDVAVAGIGQSQRKLNRIVTATVKSRTNRFSTKMKFLLIDDPTADLPTMPVDHRFWNLPNVPLADPKFHVPGRIDLIIGGETYWMLHTGKKVLLGPDQPFMVETRFGWTMSGTVISESTTPPVCNVSTQIDRLEAAIQKFWELETLSSGPAHSPEERRCEEIYATTTTQEPSGRYIVRLPKSENTDVVLGESRSIAEQRLFSLERRLSKEPEVYDAYRRFMKEYEDLGHMRRLSEPIDNTEPHCFLPHHPVFKSSSTTTKTRVVFDASSKTTSGYSLNDMLIVGPVVQHDLLSLIMRFRTRAIALVSDIEKMYRQIILHPEDQKLQRILWRSSPDEPVSSFQLQTVTYGTASAPYLATKTIQQVATVARDSFPVAADAIADDFYVDDFLSGADDIPSASQLRRDVTNILGSAGFALKKWASNAPEILEEIPVEDRAVQPVCELQDEQAISTLGLIWEPASDTLGFKVQLPLPAVNLTKRNVMSYIAKIFDPLGLVGPTITKTKLFMQRLWALKDSNNQRLGWDQPLPARIQEEWKGFHNTIDLLRQVRVPRFVARTDVPIIQLHFFADASEKAYGACCYVRAENSSGTSVQLLASKSKVAPLSITTSIARLELCAARLSVQLYKKVTGALKRPFSAVLWTDSTTVLHWLNSSPSRWKPFVANRVSQIQQATEISNWRHVPGNDNPADHISRGLTPVEILNSLLWWYGPPWLSSFPDTWPSTPSYIESVEAAKEGRKVPFVAMTIIETNFCELLFSRYSNYTRLKRIVAYCLRFIKKLRDRATARCLTSRVHQEEDTGCSIAMLASEELQQAEVTLCRLAQRESFPEELANVAEGERVCKASTLKFLSPIIDHNGVLRVGGRLRNANISDSAKHPILLSSKHPLSALLANQCHKALLHAGPQLMLTTLRSKFWILGGRNLVRKTYHKCITCF
ncbi:uncharacterized protein LOC131694986 [Topomyia yanbarensis]|uniref:uncharacterized protein LOC131694986 n=1 Tax=Topomyia yanbarensis TaxID=2498891 RepID=UPI00273CD833|nr:uncharacterized protein LOC131694986 [Topomyia yanbarensis]